jgi:hypothetical protein
MSTTEKFFLNLRLRVFEHDSCFPPSRLSKVAVIAVSAVIETMKRRVFVTAMTAMTAISHTAGGQKHESCFQSGVEIWRN